MLEDHHFLRETVVDIDAAVVGVSSNDWIGISEPEATPEKAAALMKERRFDILPIISHSPITQYFHTDRWNDYLSVSRKALTHRDLIPFKTSLHDLIRKFAIESRDFYFLTNERRIVGLVSVVNLNCRQVKVYLFSLLSELETALGRFVAKRICNDELLGAEFGSTARGRKADVRKRYLRAKGSGYDVPLIEYMYLRDLIDLIAGRDWFGSLDYECGSTFEASLGPVIELRNTVSHPVRSLITGQDCCKRLWERLDCIDKLLFTLRDT